MEDNEIIDGGGATFTIQSVGPAGVAQAAANSNDPGVFPTGAIVLSLIANNEIVVTSSASNVSLTLCGASAPQACFGA